jgi:membrane-associated protein
MEYNTSYVHELLNPSALVKDFGYLGIFITLFLESGIIFGFFLPGDSLLFTAGLLASQHYLNLVALILVSIAAAILGNSAGYYTGRRFGRSMFSKPKSFWFSPKRIDEAHRFFEKQGPQSLILARFIPAVRTFIPIAAGIGSMRYRTFLLFNAAGGILWGLVLPVLGYEIGKRVPSIDKYLLPMIFLIIILSAVPAVWHHYRYSKRRGA